MAGFVDAFEAMFLRLFAFPKPTVAAVNGHAIAGGCILAMACDARVLARGPISIAVNEVLLGIPFPAGAFEIARNALPGSARAAAMVEGRTFSSEQMAAFGFGVLASEHGVVADAVSWAERLSAGAPGAVAAVKADLVAPVLARVEDRRLERRERFLDAWFGDEARGRVRAVLERIGKKA
jgi:enoyl-CoA hydratase